MKPLASFLLLIALFCSCKNEIKKPSLLRSSNLKSNFITINADSAYTLKTSKGTVLKIAKNTFDVPANTKVIIELKEAFTAQDILLAGLTTTSNGRLLKSGGMIYINATVDKKEVKYLKSVDISIPTKDQDSNMQLFKGEIKEDSSINWTAPISLDSMTNQKQMPDGEFLFKANCANCHHPIEDRTGPRLAGARSRAPNPEWPYKFVNNVNSMLETDAYAKLLFAKYGSKMTQFNLRKEEIKAILDYCENDDWGLPVAAATLPLDSLSQKNIDCGYDTVPVPEEIIEILPDDPIVIDTISVDTDFYNFTNPTYNFNVYANGWYNIDCFIDQNKNEVTPVQLAAVLNMPIDTAMDVYLCSPKRKLLTKSYYHNDKKYTFFDNTDEINLVLYDEAFVFVVGSYKDKMYYGIARFNIQLQQVVTINVKESTQEDILRSIKNNQLDGVKIDMFGPIKFIDPKYNSPNETINDSTQMEMQILPRSCDTSRKILADMYVSKY